MDVVQVPRVDYDEAGTPFLVYSAAKKILFVVFSDQIGVVVVNSVNQCSELRTMSARTSATDHAFVWSKPSSKRHVHLQTVRWPSRKGDLS
jgi:hypothetical protein